MNNAVLADGLILTYYVCMLYRETFCVKEGECYLAETLDFQVVFCVVSEYIFDKRHAFSGCYLFFQNCQQTYFALFTSGHHHTT